MYRSCPAQYRWMLVRHERVCEADFEDEGSGSCGATSGSTDASLAEHPEQTRRRLQQLPIHIDIGLLHRVFRILTVPEFRDLVSEHRFQSLRNGNAP